MMAISPTEAAHRAASDRELVTWVDETDQVLGALPRAELRERGLIGRCTFILLFNSAGELCVHRRTLSKALYPGYWDVAAGGMVTAGEAYAESAARELPQVSLEDSLEVLLVMAEQNDGRYHRAAAKWASISARRCAAKVQDVGTKRSSSRSTRETVMPRLHLP